MGQGADSQRYLKDASPLTWLQVVQFLLTDWAQNSQAFIMTVVTTKFVPKLTKDLNVLFCPLWDVNSVSSYAKGCASRESSATRHQPWQTSQHWFYMPCSAGLAAGVVPRAFTSPCWLISGLASDKRNPALKISQMVFHNNGDTAELCNLSFF